MTCTTQSKQEPNGQNTFPYRLFSSTPAVSGADGEGDIYVCCLQSPSVAFASRLPNKISCEFAVLIRYLASNSRSQI